MKLQAVGIETNQNLVIDHIILIFVIDLYRKEWSYFFRSRFTLLRAENMHCRDGHRFCESMQFFLERTEIFVKMVSFRRKWKMGELLRSFKKLKTFFFKRTKKKQARLYFYSTFKFSKKKLKKSIFYCRIKTNLLKERVYWTNDFLEQTFQKTYPKKVFLWENERKRWKIKDIFENEQNHFFERNGSLTRTKLWTKKMKKIRTRPYLIWFDITLFYVGEIDMYIA